MLKNSIYMKFNLKVKKCFVRPAHRWCQNSLNALGNINICVNQPEHINSVQVILTYKILGGYDYQYYDSMFQQPIRDVRQRDLNHKQNEC